MYKPTQQLGHMSCLRNAEALKPIVAVVGDANLTKNNSSFDRERAEAAEGVGRALIEAGARVLTGGKVKTLPL
jgi:hypothetical protein